MPQDSQKRRISELQLENSELRKKLAESEKLRAAAEHSMMEVGLRLSQENEVLRKELAALTAKSAGRRKAAD